jgi:hypothetical protein
MKLLFTVAAMFFVAQMVIRSASWWGLEISKLNLSSNFAATEVSYTYKATLTAKLTWARFSASSLNN